MSLTRRLSLNPGDLVKNRLGVEIVLSAKPSIGAAGRHGTVVYDRQIHQDDEVYVGIMGSGAAQSIYVITPHGSGWVASAEVEAVAVVAHGYVQVAHDTINLKHSIASSEKKGSHEQDH